MRHRRLTRHLIAAGLVLAAGLVPALVPAGQAAWAVRASHMAPSARSSQTARAIANVSGACSGQNAEVETAIDPATGILYEEWIGCGGIGFARSTDGGRTFSRPLELPGSAGGWDPAITVGKDGEVYAAFMVSRHTRSYPVVDISADHGLTFPRVSPLIPPRKNNWGDRDFVAVGKPGVIYVTWDYGPHNLTAKDFVCSPTGSCSFVAGDLNAVVQTSTNNGKTWGKITPISPGFPASGADSAPILVGPRGRLDVLYQGYNVLSRKTLKLGVAHSFFATSTNGGRSWSKPVRIGPSRLSMNTTEWWIDGSIGIDAAGNLYATWDTQSGGHDVGWLAFSTDHGRSWSRLVRVTSGTSRAVHIVQVIGAEPGVAYVGWLTDAHRCGSAPCYGQYLRAFSISKGWLTRVIRVSASDGFGNWLVWPGDTIGLSLYPGGSAGHQRLAVSWGSAIGGKKADSQIRASVIGSLP